MKKATIIIALIIILIYSFTPQNTKTVVLNSNDSFAIQKQITEYCKIGFSVKHITCQSVSVSDGGYGHSTLKGNIIVIMEK